MDEGPWWPEVCHRVDDDCDGVVDNGFNRSFWILKIEKTGSYA
ncbi:MAG: hypothetical protein HY391_03650 [Deltaproteobacteria bacterium]|nr:hypothetical protein [Deltaproteobacteria bacterium]